MSSWLERSQSCEQRKHLLFDSLCSGKQDLSQGRLMELVGSLLRSNGGNGVVLLLRLYSNILIFTLQSYNLAFLYNAVQY